MANSDSDVVGLLFSENVQKILDWGSGVLERVVEALAEMPWFPQWGLAWQLVEGYYIFFGALYWVPVEIGHGVEDE